MRSFVETRPVAGNLISATTIGRIFAEIRACRPIAGPGIATRRTPSGTHLSARFTKAVAGKSAPEDKSCFAIESIDTKYDEATGKVKSVVLRLKNQYLMVGGCLTTVTMPEIDDDDLDDDKKQGIDIFESPIVAVLLEAAGSGKKDGDYKTYSSLSDMESEMTDLSKYIVPLYAFDKKNDYALLTDFRNAPNVQVYEGSVG